MPQLDTLVVPIGGGGLISGMAVAAKSLKPELQIIGVQAQLYPSMYNAIKGESLPMRGDTLAEGIAVKAPGRITTDIIRRLVDDIMLVTEDQIERAVAMLIAIEKTVVEGAGAAGLAAVLAAPERFAGRNVGLVLTGGNIDTRLIASVLTRELAREGRLTQIAIDIVDRPGQLAAVSALLAEAGANIIEVSHQRTFSDLPAKGTLLEVVIETRDRAHLDEVMKRLGGGRVYRVVAGAAVNLELRWSVKSSFRAGRFMFALVRYQAGIRVRSEEGRAPTFPSRRGPTPRIVFLPSCASQS